MLSEEQIHYLMTEHEDAQDNVNCLNFARAIEQAVIAELLAGVEMPEPALIDQFSYVTAYTADQLRTAIARAKLQQREADAAVCDSLSRNATSAQSGNAGDLSNVMLRHHSAQAAGCADAIRKGGANDL